MHYIPVYVTNVTSYGTKKEYEKILILRKD